MTADEIAVTVKLKDGWEDRFEAFMDRAMQEFLASEMEVDEVPQAILDELKAYVATVETDSGA